MLHLERTNLSGFARRMLKKARVSQAGTRAHSHQEMQAYGSREKP
jgi:hypothetical protein